jgi:MFS family permease
VEARSLLRPLAVPGFRLLFASASASSIGTLLAAVALAIDVKDRTQSGWWVAALLVVEFLPTIVIGLALGPLVDRLSRRGLMVAADVVRAAVFCGLPFASRPETIVALAAVAGVANGFFRPAAYAGMPNLVPDEQLPAANGLMQAVENVSWAIGPVLGGLLTGAWGPHTAYWVNAASFLVSAVLIGRIPAGLLQSAVALSKGYWQDVGDGIRTVRRSRVLLAVVVTWSLAMAGFGAVEVGQVFIAKDSFGAGDFGYGLLYGAVGMGLVVGSLAGGPLAARLPLPVLYGGALLWMGLCFAGTAASPSIWVGSAVAGLSGIGNGVAVVCNITLVQRGAGDDMRGRALTVIMGVNYVVLAAAMVAAGPFIDAFGARWAWLGGALLTTVAAAVGAVMTRDLRRLPEGEPGAALLEPELDLRSSTAPL